MELPKPAKECTLQLHAERDIHNGAGLPGGRRSAPGAALQRTLAQEHHRQAEGVEKKKIVSRAALACSAAHFCNRISQCRVMAHRHICQMKQSSVIYDEIASLRDGLYTMTDMNISSAVTDRLTGYAVMIAWKVLCDGNIAKIQNILTPQTPMIVRSAGTRDFPKPRR